MHIVKQILVILTFVITTFILFGCDGTGGVGGQGFNMTFHQTNGKAAYDGHDQGGGQGTVNADDGQNTINVTVNVEDGGTGEGAAVANRDGEDEENPSETQDE